MSHLPDDNTRRRFLEIMGASMALGAASACTKQPREGIAPYAGEVPEEFVPGDALYFATAVVQNGLAQGVLVKSNMGRPTKIEGNPLHPASLGASDVPTQAAILSLYDPDRSGSLRGPQGAATWGDFETAARAFDRTGFRVLTTTVTSPTLGRQIGALLAAFPGSRWFQYEPTGPHSGRAASAMIFGRAINHWPQFDKARVVLALDSDFLACGPRNTRYARDFISTRPGSRLYAAESTMTATGGKADHRWALAPHAIEALASELAVRLGVPGAVAAGSSGVAVGELEALAEDLRGHRGAAIVTAGDEASPRTHALAHAINHALAAPVIYTEPVEFAPADQIADIRELTGEMNAGKVRTLLMIGGNPVYNAPADLEFGRALSKVPVRAHLAQHDDETSALCTWHLPESHSLEIWSDARAFDGTVTILQPLIDPLYPTRSAHELVSIVQGAPARGYDIVRANWSRLSEAQWNQAVHDGVVADSGFAALPNLVPGPVPGPGKRNEVSGLTVTFRPDPYFDGGQLANNAWLQELPRPMTKLTWDNAVHLSPATARKLGVSSEDVVELRHNGRSVSGPVLVTSGQPDDCATLYLGFGRTRAGKVGNGSGFSAYALRTVGELHGINGVAIRRTGEHYPLAVAQLEQDDHGREPFRAHGHEPPKELTLYKPWNYTGYAWGMAIDLTACVNCNACVIACQAENNIAVVGKTEVRKHRSMHWIRVDTYYEQDGTARYQPVPCMHCENAPCEVVCPVHATVHSRDGLNDMVYNRCVGTRYCSNNCPYKVRRFNFYLYSDWVTPSLKLQRNPDVTVRSRGVMEKCTYCVQRIRRTEIDARRDNRRIVDDELQTACQQACPTRAIVFGDINNRESAVSAKKADKRNFSLLAELNTRPRTTYLSEERNPNPAFPRRNS